jgi:predicted DNA-binding transcriptional regulator YafY
VRGDQLARQWQLIQRLAKSRGGCQLDALAEELGCVRRTLYRDLDALMFAGFPVVSERRDGRAHYRFLDTFRLGDLPFTADEILALAFGEDLLRTLEGTVFHDSIRSALAKIRAGLSPELADYLARLGESFRVLPGPHKNYARFRDTIQSLHDAVLGRRSVRMRYRTGWIPTGSGTGAGASTWWASTTAPARSAPSRWTGSASSSSATNASGFPTASTSTRGWPPRSV